MLQEVNKLSNEPLKLFQMFNTDKSQTLCTFGELYISGLKNVRKDLMEKFADVRGSLHFEHKNIEMEELCWLSWNSELNFTMMEDHFQSYFDEDKIRKIKKFVAEESLNNNELAKLKDDDLLNFSNMGMSLLDITDGNINQGFSANLQNVNMKKKSNQVGPEQNLRGSTGDSKSTAKLVH